MRRLNADRGPVRAAVRGVAFIWAIVVGFPLMFLGLSMAVDFTRIILAGREVTTAADAAALAGAYQFVPGEAKISSTAAPGAAAETMCVASKEGALKHAAAGLTDRVSCMNGGTASASLTLDPTSTQATVTTWYTVPNLLLLRYFGYSSIHERKVVRTAAICSSTDTAGPTSGNCARPQN